MVLPRKDFLTSVRLTFGTDNLPSVSLFFLLFVFFFKYTVYQENRTHTLSRTPLAKEDPALLPGFSTECIRAGGNLI